MTSTDVYVFGLQNDWFTEDLFNRLNTLIIYFGITLQFCSSLRLSGSKIKIAEMCYLYLLKCV